MATLLDYLIPDTMSKVQNLEKNRRLKELETVAAFMKQPDIFQGVPTNRVPGPEVLAAYQSGTGLEWPKAPVEQTGQGPVGAPASMLATNMPEETLAVMRSPISQASHEMNQKAVAEALAKIKGRETTLESEGDLPQREFAQKAGMMGYQAETLGDILRPYGYDDTDIMASITGKYPMAKQIEQARAKKEPSEPKLYETTSGWLPAEQAVGKAKPRGTGAESAEKVPPRVKQAQDFIKRLVPQLTGQVNPMYAMMLSFNPDAARSTEVMKAIQGSGLPDELKSLYNQAVQILNEWYSSQLGGQAPAAQPGGSAQDPLGIR